jgi:hypothetical protein
MAASVSANLGIEQAKYRNADQEPDPVLRDNPMALVFPAPMAPEELYDALAVDPPIRDADFDDKPLEVRLEGLDRLDECYTPFPQDGDIVGAVLSLLRKSFRFRHPKLAQVMYFIMRVASGVAGSLPRMQPTGGGGALGLLISGPSGTGKSSLIDRIVEFLGRDARYHLSLFGKPCCWPQLGVIRITVGETWKDTLIEISKEIDRQYGRDVLFTRERHATEPRLQQVVWTALCSGFAPCIILDEFQRLGDLHHKVAAKILKKLLDLMQDGGIPVIVVGTVAVRKLFEAFPMEMGKFSPGSGFQFQRLAEADLNTINLIVLLKEQSVSIGPIEYSADFDRYLILHSMGVRRVIRDFMRWVFQRHAVAESNGQTIVADKHLLMSVAEHEMLAWQKALTAMRKFDLGFGRSYEELQAYEHFLPPEQAKKQTRAQKVTEALWRAEDQVAVDDDFRLISVEDFIFLRAQVALRQHEEDAERAAHQARQAAEQAGSPEQGEAVKEPKRRRKSTAAPENKKAEKKAGKAQEPADPRSNVIPLASVKRPRPEPEQGVDPTNLPD